MEEKRAALEKNQDAKDVGSAGRMKKRRKAGELRIPHRASAELHRNEEKKRNDNIHGREKRA